jgi:hypothetical protein
MKTGLENYTMNNLVADVVAVIRCMNISKKMESDGGLHYDI